jgi:membrane protein implicated in regulation of membrane protease activity
MMEWLRQFMSPWFIWAMVGLVLILAEFAMPGLIVIFFGVGALLVAVLAACLPVPLVVQLVVFLVVSVGLLVGLRRWATRVFTGWRRDGASSSANTSDFLGEIGVVVGAIPAVGEGRVELHGTQWDAISASAIAEGERVVVTGQRGSVLEVKTVG